MSERVRCPECRKIVAGRILKGGDGSELYPVWHKCWQMGIGDSYTDGMGGMGPCDGRFIGVSETLGADDG